MKILLLMIACIVSITVMGQNTLFNDTAKTVGLNPNPANKLHVSGEPTVPEDSIWKSAKYLSYKRPEYTVGWGITQPNHMIHIMGNSKNGKGLGLDIRDDSLIVTGNLDMNEAARIFIDYCRQYIHCKIDSLEIELKNCKRK